MDGAHHSRAFVVIQALDYAYLAPGARGSYYYSISAAPMQASVLPYGANPAIIPVPSADLRPWTDAQKKPVPTPQQTSPTPPPLVSNGNGTCRFFERGDCHFGSKCRARHAPPDLIQVFSRPALHRLSDWHARFRLRSPKQASHPPPFGKSPIQPPSSRLLGDSPIQPRARRLPAPAPLGESPIQPHASRLAAPFGHCPIQPPATRLLAPIPAVSSLSQRSRRPKRQKRLQFWLWPLPPPPLWVQSGAATNKKPRRRANLNARTRRVPGARNGLGLRSLFRSRRTISKGIWPGPGRPYGSGSKP